MAKKSVWIDMAQDKDANVEPCSACKGTGASTSAVGTACTACNGFGY